MRPCTKPSFLDLGPDEGFACFLGWHLGVQQSEISSRSNKKKAHLGDNSDVGAWRKEVITNKSDSFLLPVGILYATEAEYAALDWDSTL